jgi:uncharacterized membrane protein
MRAFRPLSSFFSGAGVVVVVVGVVVVVVAAVVAAVEAVPPSPSKYAIVDMANEL